MRMLVVAPQPFFTPRGTPFSVYYRTLVTAELGAEIDFLTYGEGQDVDIPHVRIVRIPRLRFLEPVPIGPSWKKLFLDWFIALWLVGLLLRRKPDVVHAHEESVFLAAFLKPLFRFRLIYDMHSSLPQQLRNFDFTTSRLLIGIFERLERWAIRRADAVVTISPELSRCALSLVRRPERHFLIENSIFDPVRVRSSVRHDGFAVLETPAPKAPEGRPLIVYAGTLEHYQGIPLLLHAFAALHLEVPEAFLLVLGGTPEQVEQLRGTAARLRLDDDCHFAGRVSQGIAAKHLRMASVIVSPRIEGTNTPLKVYEQLASGVPLVATRILSHTQVLDDSVCFLVDADPISMAEGLLAALRDEPKRRAVVAAARSLYEERYSREAYVSKVRRLLEAVA